MATWAKEEIELKDGTKVAAQLPFCHYCYANINDAVAMANWKRHCACKSADTIKGELFAQNGHYIGRQSVSKGGRFL